MRKAAGAAALLAVGWALLWFAGEARRSHLAWSDFTVFLWKAPSAARASGAADAVPPRSGDPVQFVGLTQYLNNARAVVTHTIDDSTKYVPAAIETMDRYGIKATIFISTDRGPIEDLWPILRRAVHNGHEIGSHSRTHPCLWPPSLRFCFFHYTDYEIAGSRDDILRNTDQPHVWSFAYPCGLCTKYDFVHRKLERAGYLVARNYPNEETGGHIVPDMQSYDPHTYNATYTQVVQKKGGIAPTGRTDLAAINGKFDEVYGKGGIYNFMSHPQWLDYGPDKFYEQHLRYVSNRQDVWYVPMGPLYAYRRVVQHTQVRRLGPDRFAATCSLDPKVFPVSVTLEFRAPESWTPEADGRVLAERKAGLTDRWNEQYFRREGEKLYVTVRPSAVVVVGRPE